MKKVTIASTALAASICLGTQSAMAAGSLDDKDMLFAFGAESSVNTMMLSEQEMVETEGEFLPLVAAFTFLGGYTGGVSYLATTNNPNWSDALWSVGWGAIAGGTGAATGGVGWGLFGVGSAAASNWSPSTW